MTRRPEQLGIRITDSFIPYYDAMKEEAKLRGCSVSDIARMIIQDVYSSESDKMVLREGIPSYTPTPDKQTIDEVKNSLLQSTEFKQILREEIKNALREILESQR